VIARRRLVWAAFAACCTAGAAVLVAMSLATLRFEQASFEARGAVAHESRIGTALWRMDSWLAPLLAQEAARPWSEYRTFQSQQEAYTNTLSKLAPNQVVTPSPLLGFRSELIQLHFQVEPDGQVVSPQVPAGNELDLVQSLAPGLDVTSRQALLDRLRRLVSVPVLAMGCSKVASHLPDLNPVSPEEAKKRADAVPSWRDFESRAQTTKLARQSQAAAPAWVAAPATGPLLPVWLSDATNGDLLVYARRVLAEERQVFQGFVVDWPRLSRELLAQLAGIELSAATLRRADPADAKVQGRLLATVPAALCAEASAVCLPFWSPARTVLAVAWGGSALVAATIAFVLAAALAFGERRARFASAVTHELRTPLTTFRMYSEMLATDMVRDPEKRRQYLETLRSEADRLARLVENVLSWARLEEGRFAAHRESVKLSGLVERLRPTLERRAAQAGFELRARVAADGELTTDVEAVGQVLFNLVDNACKYGRGPLELDVERHGGGARIALRDHGPGIAPELRQRVFEPFDRGALAPGDNSLPGIGLGLALSRGLARDLGGRLLVEDAAPGARFVLELPA
jgi:signal transduction histidine kinase